LINDFLTKKSNNVRLGKTQTMNKIIFLVGPSCAGKSTLAKLMGRQVKGSLRMGADQLRGNLFHYDKDNEQHVRLRNDFFEQTLELFLGSGIAVIFCEIPRSLYSNLAKYCLWAESAGFEPFIFYAEANDPVLLDRFRMRKVFAQKEAFPLAISDEGGFLETVQEYRKLIEKTVLKKPIHSLDTSVQLPEKTVALVFEKVGVRPSS
jgi:ABC-type oligopeptide transport system ATPase subunit